MEDEKGDIFPAFPPKTLLIPKDGIRSEERPDGTFDVSIDFVHASPEDLEFIRAREMSMDQINRTFLLPSLPSRLSGVSHHGNDGR